MLESLNSLTEIEVVLRWKIRVSCHTHEVYYVITCNVIYSFF